MVSAFATRGLSADVMRLVLSRHELVVVETVLEEVERVLAEKLRVPRPIVNEALALLREHPTHSVPPSVPGSPLSGNDAKILASALAAGTDVLVTGDHDFLDVREEIDGIEIVDPREFWEMERG